MWIALSVLVLGGIVQRLQGPPKPVINYVTRETPLAQSSAALSFAEQVAFAYLSWDSDDSAKRDDRLLRLGLVDTFSPVSSQSVISVQAGKVYAVAKERAYVYVDTLVRQRGQKERALTLAVPVVAAGDELGLFAKPAILPGRRYAQRDAAGVEDDAYGNVRDGLTRAAESFFKVAATTDDLDRLSYFAGTGATVHGVAFDNGAKFAGFDEAQFEARGNQARAYLTARIAESSGDEVIASYYLSFVRKDGRWLITKQVP